jgi:hypothetical protein
LDVRHPTRRVGAMSSASRPTIPPAPGLSLCNAQQVPPIATSIHRIQWLKFILSLIKLNYEVSSSILSCKLLNCKIGSTKAG